jgi:predicted ATP-dependent endonuclease of OLD family
MDLKAFRVRMYKGILDSGWVDIDSLTVLVGKNESGKTSLLKALHKLNPYESDPYEMVKEWPRGLRTERSEEHVVCVARFQLSDQEKSELTEITHIEKIPDIVEASRNYSGKLEIKFEEELSLDESIPVEIDTTEIDAILDKLPKVRDNFSDEFKKYADECLNEARRLASENQFIELEQLVQTHKPLLKEKRVQSHADSYRVELRFTKQYLAGLDQLVQNLPPLLSVQSKVDDYLIEHLPTFIYMDDYRAFSGTAHLDDIKTRRDSGRLTEEDKTFLTILGLSNLDLDDLVQLGQGTAEQVEERQYDLDDGAATLTKIISGRFRQRRYEVTYRADGLSFFTFVKDNRDPALIKLEERSKGFQWFFSFDLMFMHESKGTFEGCVILLDEPGLHLHPEAQKDLLLRLEEYAKGNILLYTTHLPFMIDLNHPDRVRVLKETENGIIVTTDFIESPPEAKFVLQAALGMDASQSFLVADRNLVVEGVNDYWILTELSSLLQQDGKEGRPKDVLITPAGSASTAVHIATIMIGQNLDVVALFDSDDEGRRAQGKLDHNWLTRYKGTQTKTLLLGDAVGACGDFALEDLFPENFITDIVKEVYSGKLAAADIDEITLQGEGILWQKIVRFMKGNGIEGINKGPIAKQLRNKLSDMTDVSELPEGTEEKAVKLFQEIRNAFGEK